MNRKDNNYLLQALEAATAECRRLSDRVAELEEILAIEEERKFNSYNEQNFPDHRPVRNRKRRNRTYRPWQKKEEEKEPQVQIEVVRRRTVDDVYREQKKNHEEKIAREAAAAMEQERLADEAYESSKKNEKPVEVRLSEAKKQLIIETGKLAMAQTGN